MMVSDKTNELVQAVCSYMHRMHEQYAPQRSRSDIEPFIYYMNGVDGTWFDVDYNNRICELQLFFPEEKGGMGFMKAYLTTDGNIEGYIWPDGEMRGTELPKESFCSVEDTDSYFNALNHDFDSKLLWNQIVLEY